ncbi:hypothetical protein [uncultured Photobacterium sp.]|uniref:hypothetical protein n=1 Tax=uncultured Photobacterium sp. TaxID=173973 RepID=UPI002619BCB5|nr:hypothetical protein [uncultured Photobacterium sp.]
MENIVVYYMLSHVIKNEEQKRITAQLKKAGFEGTLKVYDLGGGSKASSNLVVKGVYQGQRCCCAVGYERKRNNLIIRQIWSEHVEV